MTKHVSRIVGLGWGLFLLVTLVYVWKYSSNVPYWDDWLIVPALTAEEGPTLGYFWEQDNEHRLALSRLLLVAWITLADVDFRAPLFVQVAILGAISLALMRLMARLRGYASLTDLLIPMLLLHVGHHENLLWAWQLSHILVLGLVGTLLALILASGGRLTSRTIVLTGFVLVALPGCGAPALAYVPCGLLWLAGASISAIRAGESGSTRRAVLTLAVVAVGFGATVTYFLGLETYESSSAAQFGAVISAMLQFLSLGFGPAGLSLAPYLGVATALLVLSSVGLLLQVVRRRPAASEVRGWGLLFFLGSVSFLALGIGVRRTQSGGMGYYAIYAAPALLASYAVWQLYGGPRGRSVVAFGICLGALALLGPNTFDAVEKARVRQANMEAFEQDLAKGSPLYLLLARHTRTIWPTSADDETVASYLLLMREAEIGNYALIEDNPVFRRISLPVAPARVEGGVWNGQTFRGKEMIAFLDFQLPEKMAIAGIELECTYVGSGMPFVLVDWPTPRQPTMTGGYRFGFVPASGHCTSAEGKPIRVWVGEEIDRFRMFPNYPEPFEVRIEQIVLLVHERQVRSRRKLPR